MITLVFLTSKGCHNKLKCKDGFCQDKFCNNGYGDCVKGACESHERCFTKQNKCFCAARRCRYLQ